MPAVAAEANDTIPPDSSTFVLRVLLLLLLLLLLLSGFFKSILKPLMKLPRLSCKIFEYLGLRVSY